MIDKTTATAKLLRRNGEKLLILIKRWWKAHTRLRVLIIVGFVAGRLKFGSWTLALVPFVIIVTAMFGFWLYGYHKKAREAEAPVPTPLDALRAWWFQMNRLDMAKRLWDSACVGYGLSRDVPVQRLVPWSAGKPQKIKGEKIPVMPSLIDAEIPIDGDPVIAKIEPGKCMVPVDKVIKAAPLLAEAIGCREVVVNRSRVNGQATVRLYWKDPLERPFSIKHLPVPSTPGTLACGRSLNSTAATLSWEAGPVMIVGATGSGKSGVIWNILGDAVDRHIPTEVMAADPKGGMELRAMKRNLQQQMGDFQVSFFAENPAATVTMVNRALTEMRRRQPLIEDRKLTEPTEEFPLLIVVIDEWLTVLPLLLDGGRRGEQAPIIQLLTEGRSALVWIVAAAQSLHADIAGKTRNLYTQRLLLRVNSASAVNTVIPDGLERGIVAHQLDKMQDRGMGWSDDDHGNLERFRAALITKDDIERILDGKSPKGMTAASRAGRKAAAKDTYVYTATHKDLVGPDGQVIPFNRVEYVGRTNDLKTRFAGHALKDRKFCREHGQYENWWNVHVDLAKMLTEGPFTLEEAKRVEQDKIESLLPFWNDKHNAGNPASYVTAKLTTFPTRLRTLARTSEVTAEPSTEDLNEEAAAMIEKSRRVPVPPLAVLTVLYGLALAGAAFGVVT